MENTIEDPRSRFAVADCSVNVIDSTPELFANFNRCSFLFRHRLADNPLFSIQRLAQLAQSMLDQGKADGFVVYDAKRFSKSTGFGAGSPQARVADAVRDLETGETWLKLSRSNEADPAYAEVLAQTVRDLERLTGQELKSEISWGSLTVIMASPGITTPYHIDHETNFLFQIKGEKDVCLFSQTDPELLTTAEIEGFYSGNMDAARYKPDLQDRGTVYRLAPGRAVHQPPLAPHWVRNGSDVSISVSMTFCLRSLDRRAKVYQTNALLRRLGLRPKPPGKSAVRDRLKSVGLEWASKADPTSFDDVLFSGLRRIRRPIGLMSRIASRNP